jgi:hypothetical protein
MSKGDCITVSWLETFASGRLINPSVNRIQPLYEFLSGKKLLDE